MRVLLTGGAGFIGSHLTASLLASGFAVDCVDNLSTGREENITGYLPDANYRFFRASADNQELMGRLIPEADVIYHMAASVGVKTIMNETVHSIENNLFPTALVLRLADKHKKRIFTFSTSEIYGKSEKFPFREEDDAVLGPVNKVRWSYAASKLVDDYLARAYFIERQTKVTMVRLFNTIGSGQIGHYGMVVPRFFEQARSNVPITVYGDGSQTRCFSDVRDVVQVLLRLIDEPSSHGELINVGSTEEITILDLAKKIREVCGSNSEITHIPFEKVYGPHFDDMKRRVPSNQKLSQIAKYKFAYDLETTLRWIALSFSSSKPKKAGREGLLMMSDTESENFVCSQLV